MSQTYEDCPQLFCICCKDVGLDCNCTVYGFSKKSIIDKAILHMLENHAINPEEMTTCMRLKIVWNVRTASSLSPVPSNHNSHNIRFGEC